MPTNLIDDNTQFPTPIAVPAAGEPRTAASIQSPVQQLANRSANNKARIDAITSGNLTGGVRQLQRAASIAAMSAIASLADGDMCLVDSVGLYEYVFASSAALVTNIVAAASGGVGRWILAAAGLGLMGAANGVAQADATGRTPASSVRNGLVGMGSSLQIPVSISSPTMVDFAGASVTLTGLAIGDVAFMSGSLTFAPATGATGNIQPTVVRPDAAVIAIGSAIQVVYLSGAPTSNAYGFGVAYTATQSGTHTFKLQGSSSATATLGGTMNVFVIRP